MRWTPGGVSSNVEDRRGAGGGGFRMGGGAGMGIGGTLILLVLSLLFGRNLFTGSDTGAPTTTTSGGEVVPGAPGTSGAVQSTPAEDKLVQFVSFVLDDAQTTWGQVLPQQAGTPYRDAKLVLFRDAVQSGCGVAETAAGPLPGALAAFTNPIFLGRV